MGIIECQRETMETMRSSFEFAMRVQLPPATRQAIANMVRCLREDPPAAAVLATQARSVSPVVAALVGQELTPAQVDEIRLGVNEIWGQRFAGQMSSDNAVIAAYVKLRTASPVERVSSRRAMLLG